MIAPKRKVFLRKPEGIRKAGRPKIKVARLLKIP
jgi:hypothetical protein